MNETRRNFIKKSTIAGTALAISPFHIFGKGSPNEKIVVAAMGVRSRGMGLATNFAQMPNVEIAYVCDVDDRYTENCIAQIEKITYKKPKGIRDIRKALDDKAVDAVFMATPDHWHAPGAILAMSAGKHVYLEKPCSHNPAEGEMLIKAVERYGRVFQMGNQRRSWPNMLKLMADIQSDIIGNIYFAKGWYANNRKPIGFGKEAPVPDYLDFDLWQGPAPRTAYRDNIHPYNWHWFKRWGTGEALNNGTHEIDVMRWGMGLDYPSRVVATGGRYHYDDDWEFPDTMVATYEFEEGKSFTWEGRSCNILDIEGDGRGVIFYGEKGSIVVTGDAYTVYDNLPGRNVIKEVGREKKKPAADSTNTVSPDATLDGVHIKNFLDGIRENIPVNSPIEESHKSILMCQLANISWETGSILDIDQRNGRIIGNKTAMELWGREYAPGWEPKV